MVYNLANKRKSVLVTGASGFLGRELIELLIYRDDFMVLALTSSKERLTSFFGNTSSLECFNINEWKDKKLPWHKVDILIHCAFARGYRTDKEIAESLDFTNKLFLDAIENDVKNIINISSQGVYGQGSKPFWKEDNPVCPQDLYSFAKYASELLVSNIRKISNKKVNVTNLRLASLTGPKDNLHLEVISKFVIKALKSETINIIGGHQKFSYLDVRDASSAIISLLYTEPENWKEVYNLGSNQQHNIIEIASIVSEVAKKYTRKPVKIEVLKKDINLDVGMDSSLFYEDTGWKPQYNIKDIIVSLFDYFSDIIKNEDGD
ncbi:MAG: NAD(P)-dependent oxidoreductase [Tissierellia bacterium]|nr:NAD(P)-dependent oxidoreductase [Tissierellia bacterium]